MRDINEYEDLILEEKNILLNCLSILAEKVNDVFYNFSSADIQKIAERKYGKAEMKILRDLLKTEMKDINWWESYMEDSKCYLTNVLGDLSITDDLTKDEVIYSLIYNTEQITASFNAIVKARKISEIREACEEITKVKDGFDDAYYTFDENRDDYYDLDEDYGYEM